MRNGFARRGLLALSLVIAGAVIAPPARAADASAAEIQALIDQLGNDDYKTRDAAAMKLKAIGMPALPALREALNSPDAEVVTRAQNLIKRIEVRPVPGPDPHGPNGGVHASRIRLSVQDGNRVFDVTDSGRDVRIVQEPGGGITMSVTGLVDGKRVTEEYSAADAEELKRENPEAFALYEQWTGGAMGLRFGGRMQFRGGIQIAPFPVQPMPVLPDEMELLRARLDKQMRENKVKEAERTEVNAAVEKLAEVRATGGMEKYTEQCDELRKTLEQYKLDPGELLPPPAKARLGVSVSAEEGRLFVQKVGEKSRAERVGLKAGDQIRKVDGKEIGTVAELRKLVTENQKKLTVDVTRDGEDVKLEEKEEKEAK
jgi:hypothetical protein